jgi:fibronectin-binding autotransporter adhesin
MTLSALRAHLAVPLAFRRRTRSVATLVALAIAGLSCGERITAPQGMRDVSFAVAPTFTPRAALIDDALATFGLTVDNIHLVVTRTGGGTALDTTVAFPAGIDSVAIELRLPISGNTENFTAFIELRQGTVVLFSGSQGITLRVNPPAGGNAPEIPIDYVGPGSEAEAIVVLPADTTVAPGASFDLRAVALSAANDTVTNSPINWRLLDEAIGTVDSTGTFSAVAIRGNARIVAKLPNLVEDTALVRIVPPATHLAVIAGAGQTGAAGTALASPIVVQVQAADNLPVPGITVNLAVDNGGGSVTPPSAVSDTLGRVDAFFTLGTGVGEQGIRATSAGLPDLVVSATSVAGPAALLEIIVQPPDSATVGIAFDVPPVAKLRDAFGNPRLVAGTAITVALSAPTVGTIGGSTSVLTDANGEASFAGLSLNALIGSTTLTFASGALTAESDTVVMLRGPAALLTVEGGTGFNAPAGDSIPLVHAVRVTDAGTNPVDSFPLLLERVDTAESTVYTDSTGRFLLRRLGVPKDVGVYAFTFSGTGLTAPVTVTVTVIPGAVSALALSQLPSDTAVVGNALLVQPRVQLTDAFDNAVATAGVNVTAQAVGGAHTLGGTTTIATNAAGTAIFTNLVINGEAGTAQLRFVAAGLDTLLSDSIVVFPALATQLEFTLEPGSPMAGNAFNVIVTAKDDFGNTDVGFTGNVNVAIGTNPAGGVLSGTTTQAAVNGVATFNGLSLNNTGAGYTLVATSAGLTPDTTAAFEVITGVAYHDVRRPGDIAIYKNYLAWGDINENKDELALQASPFKFAPGLGDYHVRTMDQLALGIPGATSLLIITSASKGDASFQITQQNEGFANLDAWVRGGGWLVVHAGDNATGMAYQIPGMLGPVPDSLTCTGVSVAAGITDHALLRGPDALLATGDDFQPGSVVDLGGSGACHDNHGDLAGVLPGNAVALLQETGDNNAPVYATYTLGAGRVIVTTLTIEFQHQRMQTMVNHLYWAIYGENAPAAQPTFRSVNWVGGNGDWNDPTKWDIGLVPAVDDTVRIQGTGVDTVTVNSSVTAQTIIVGGAGGSQTLRVSSFLTVTDRLVVNAGTGTLFLDDARIDGNGAIDINGTLSANYGDLFTVGAVTLSSASTASLLGTVQRHFGPMLLNGPATLQDGTLSFANGAAGTIGATGTLNLTGETGQVSPGGGIASFVNNGTINRSGGTGIYHLNLPFSNDGVVNVTAGAVRVSATGSHTHAGMWNLSSGTHLEFSSGAFTLNGDVLGTGSIRNVNANPTLNGNVTVRRLQQSAGTMNFAGALTVSDSILVTNGSLNLNTGGVISVPQFNFDNGLLGGIDTLVVTDSLIWSAGGMGSGGRTVIAAGAGARATTTTTKSVTGDRDLQIAGNLRWEDGGLQVSSATITVVPTGVFDISAGFNLTVSTAGTLLNQGIVRRSTNASITGIAVPFVNEGLTEVLSGTLRINPLGTYVHPGAFTVQAGGVLEFQAGTVTLDSTVSGTGVTLFSGAATTVNAPISTSGVRLSLGTVSFTAPLVGVDSLAITSGTLNLNSLSTMSVGWFSQTAGTLQGADTLVVTDSMRWNGGNQGGTGVTRVDSGAVSLWDVTTRGLLGGRRLEVGGTLLWNTGATTLSNGSTLRIDSGAVMSIAGPHTLSAGTGGGFLQNDGALLRTGATGIATIGTGFGSTGVVDVQVGSIRLSNTGGPFTTAGLVSVATNALFEFNAGTHTASAMFAGSGVVSQTGGTVTLTGAFLAPQLSLSSGTLNLSSGAPVSIPRFLHNSGTLQGTDTLVVTDSLYWLGGNASGTGHTVLHDTAVAHLPAGGSRVLLGGRTMLIEGSAINDGSGTTFGGGSTLTVAPTGTYEIRGDFNFGTTTGGGAFINNGTLSRTTTTGLAAFNLPFYNEGTVAITSGTLRLNPPAGTYAHNGDFTVTAPGILEVAGTSTQNFLGGVSGTGSASFSATLINNTGAFSLPSIGVFAGTVDFSGNVLFEIPRLTLAGGTIQGTDTIVVSDSMTWSGGTMTGLGALRIADTASLVLATTGSRSLIGGRRIEVFGALVGQGGLVSFGGGSTLVTDTASTTALTAGLSFNTTTGSGTWLHRGAMSRSTATGTATVTVPFTNEGTVDVGIGSLVFNATGVFAHTGDFTVNAPGALTFTTGTHNVSGTVGGTGGVTVSAGTTNFSNAFSLPVFNSTGGATNFTGGVAGLDSLKTPGGTVTFSSGASINVPKFLLTGGIVQGVDTLVVTDTLEWSSGTMGGTGRTVIPVGVGAHLSTTSTKTLSGGRSMHVEGTAHWSGGAFALSASPLTVAATGQFTIAAAATMSGASGATFVNAGQLNRTTTGTAIISAPFVNNGTVAVTNGLLSLANPAGTHTHTGPFTVTSPGTIDFGGAGTQVVDSSITGTGFGRFGGTSVTVNGSYGLSGISLVAGATTFAGPVGALDTLRNASGTLTLSGGTAVPIKRLFLVSGTVQGSDSITVLDSMEWSAGTLGGPGAIATLDTVPVIFATTGTKTLSGARAMHLAGDAIWLGGSIALAGASPITLLPTGDLDIRANVSMTGGTTGGSFDNLGTIRRTAGTGFATFSVPFENSGLVQVSTGQLSTAATDTVTHSGAWETTLPAALSFSTHTQTFDGTITGTGRVLFGGTVTTVNGAMDVSSISQNAGTTNILGSVAPLDSLQVHGGVVLNLATGAPIETGVLMVAGGVLGGADTLNVLDSLFWGGGTMGGLGRTVLGDTGVFAFVSSTKNLADSRTLALDGTGSWTAGAINVNNTSLLHVRPTGSLNVTATLSLGGTGTFLNEGTTTKSAGTGAFTISSGFTNDGTVAVNIGTVSLANAGSFVHSGTFEASAGAVLNVNGGTQQMDSTITGAGRFSISAGAVVLNDSVDIPALTYSGGTLTINGPIHLADSLRAEAATVAINLNTAATIPTGSIWWLRNSGGIAGTGSIVNNGQFGKLNSSSTATVSVPFSNAGLLTADAGTLVLTRPFEHLASATIAGTAGLTITADSVTAWDGAIGPRGATGGATGQLTINGVFTQGATAPINLEIGGLTVGTNYDRLNLTSQALLNGPINVALINGFVPASGNQFTIMTYPAGTILPSCANVTLPAGLVCGTDLIFGSTSAILTIPPPP